MRVGNTDHIGTSSLQQQRRGKSSRSVNAKFVIGTQRYRNSELTITVGNKHLVGGARSSQLGAKSAVVMRTPWHWVCTGWFIMVDPRGAAGAHEWEGMRVVRRVT